MQRINAFLAQATGRSRRECDELVRDGRVTIGERTAGFSDRAGESDEVRLDGRIIKSRRYDYIAMNKPRGILTAVRDRRGKTVCDLLPPRYRSLYPVGRLDKESRGLLLLTNDGGWSYRVQHPSQGVPKVYEIALDGPLTRAEASRTVELEDGPSRFLSVRDAVPGGPTAARARGSRFEVVLVEGRKRQIRRHFLALGLRVLDLVRIRIGAITLGDLETGATRPLTREERESIAT